MTEETIRFEIEQEKDASFDTSPDIPDIKNFVVETRNGKSYAVPSQPGSCQQDLFYLQTVQRMRNDLYNRCMRLAGSSGRKAWWYEKAYLLLGLIIAIGLFVITFLSIEQGWNDNVNYVVFALSLVMGILKVFVVYFGLETRATIFRESSIKLKSIGKELDVLSSKVLTPVKLHNKVRKIQGQIDEIELAIFNSYIVTRDIAKSTKINSELSENPLSTEP